MRHLHLTLVVMLLSGSLAAQTVENRFEGWNGLAEDEFSYDPDDRRIMGFSVRASTGARTQLDEVERAWAAGQTERAVQLLRELATRSGGEVVQVAGEREVERWVGAAEWALYLLRRRASDEVMEELIHDEDRVAVQRAVSWRDIPRLQKLAWKLEGTSEGLHATVQLARLLAERGAWESSRRAADRALTLGADESMQELVARLPELPTPLDPPVSMPPDLGRSWTGTFTIGVLADRLGDAVNPLSGNPNRYEAAFAPIQPVVSEGVVFVADSLSVSAVDLVSGRLLWHHAGPMERVTLDGTERSWFDFTVYGNYGRARAINPFQSIRPVLTDKTLLATVQVTEAWHPLDKFEGYPINHPLPKRRLRALDRDTGELLWKQERPDQSERAFVNSFDVAGPPAVGGGIAYASGSVTEGAINAYLAAFDLATGDLLWKTLLCSGQQELTMFNRPFQEHVISPPLLEGGTLYVSTNLGVIGSVDAWSGRVRWLTRYESIERKGATGVRPDREVREIHWQNQEPFIEDGVLFVAPLDSRQVMALEPQTGRTSYVVESYARRRPPLRHQVLPRGDGKVLFVTDMGVECMDAQTGAVVWPHRPFEWHESIEYPVVVTGAATRSGDTLLVPCARQLVMVDVWTGDVTGTMDWQKYVRSPEVQRVVHAGSAFVMNDGQDLFVALDEARLIAESEAVADQSPSAQLTLAEFALAGSRFQEARDRFDALLSPGAFDGDPTGELRPEALRERARSGRLEAAVLNARQTHKPGDWRAVLAVAETDDQLFGWAPEALDALERAGLHAEVADWLAALAQRAPDRQVEFGPDGPQAAALLAARALLPFVSPGERLELLQGLLITGPQDSWGPLTVRQEARRRIDELLAEEGRELYAEYEVRAQAELDRGLPLEVVEVRYPNSEAVGNQRISELDRLLASGQARMAFEQVGQLGNSPEMLTLRERAARALGETEYADLLAGTRPLRAGMDRLPTLPRSGNGRVVHQMSPRNDVLLPAISGEPDAEYASCALGVIRGVGEMFLLDARSGEVRWSGRALPGEFYRGNGPPDVRFENELFVIRSGDSIEVGRLADGHPVWTRTTQRLFSSASAGGLVFLLREHTSDSLRIDALGLRTGALAYSVDLPDAQSASEIRFVGPYLVVSTQTAGMSGRPREVRLTVVDIEAGEVLSSTPMGSDLRLVNVLQDPPTIFLAGRMRSSESRLVAWSPATASTLWETVVPDESVTKLELFPTGPGRMLFCQSVSVGSTGGRADIVYPLDAARGPLEPPPGVPLFAVKSDGHGFAAPLVVMLDPVSKQLVSVLDGATADVLYTLEFDTRLDGYTQVHQGEEGYVIVSETSYEPTYVTSAWIVHGADGQERYSVQLDEPNQRDAAKVLLVDGGVLIAIGGTVHVIRDEVSTR